MRTAFFSTALLASGLVGGAIVFAFCALANLPAAVAFFAAGLCTGNGLAYAVEAIREG